ncbi:MAG: glycosyl hydrolase 53 family protein, partial [Muribaculaceae bacterium]|nr:glycosyl hydrolase 53 family protein [Muribaculaceae bacterium]
APSKHHDEGVCQDLPYVIDLCRTIKQRGFKIMLDFHYSDTWADPAKQFTPQRWQGLDATTLSDSIYTYTRHCLLAMKQAGVTPDMIQVGNEITFGMDWPVGRVDPLSDDNWDVFTTMLAAGCKACREVCPKAKIIIHTEKAGRLDMTQAYYRRLEAVRLDYDIIGLSYYPMWHGTIEGLGHTLDWLAGEYPRREVMIVEAAYYYEHDGVNRGEEDFAQCPPGTIEGQRQFTRDLVTELLKHSNVTGLFWWYPEENTFGIGGKRHGGLNRGLFNNSNGCALPALYELKRFAGR